MKRAFVRFPSFERAWKDMGLTEDDFSALEEMLLKNPKAGAVIEGSGGVRKLRFAIPGKGKSGGARVIYIDIVVDEVIYMLYAYPKSTKDNLTKAEVADFKKIADLLKQGM